jgi:hypothetical protein
VHSSNFTNFYILGSVFFVDESTIYICIFPDKKSANQPKAKTLLGNQFDFGIILQPKNLTQHVAKAEAGLSPGHGSGHLESVHFLKLFMSVIYKFS